MKEVKQPIYVKMKQGETRHKRQFYSDNKNILVDFDERWNVLGIEFLDYIEVNKKEEILI